MQRGKPEPPSGVPRQRRALDVSAAQVMSLRSGDGVELRLTRYQGGDRGPVLLAHGLGVSSLIYTLDTIDTNLLEYLFARGYDVWLFDYRNSIALPCAAARCTADEVATLDYPAAVRAVQTHSGAQTVQVVAHCYGSTTFFMAMLAGLSGVRSAVASQVGAHVFAPLATTLKCGLHLPTVLDAFGIESLTAEVGAHPSWLEVLYDQALSLNALLEAQGRCSSAVCHRVTFMYGSLYRHAQLNDATHGALNELFGVANIGAFKHLASMVRAGHIVRADRANVYLPHVSRLKLPILFLHGAENECFLPQSTQRTVELLTRENGTGLYERRVLPGYGHIDCIIGHRACSDVYPLIVEHLDATQ